MTNSPHGHHQRYLKEVSIKKAPGTHTREIKFARGITQHLESYTLATLTPNVLASDVDLTHRIATVQLDKNQETRHVPLSADAVAVFDQVLTRVVQPIDTDLLFYGDPEKDGQRSFYEFNKAWRVVLARAGITELQLPTFSYPNNPHRSSYSMARRPLKIRFISVKGIIHHSPPISL
ncbi:MAG: hypothetical protein HQM00_07430 [Magnetococcales bacterium]|nr:hypothetical protein [Magnetococcales bacterium]